MNQINRLNITKYASSYPTPTSENKPKRQNSRPAERRTRRRSRRIVPNPRLYQPPPARPPPAPRRPRAAWSVPSRALDTASRVALRVLQERRLSAVVAGNERRETVRPRWPHPAAMAAGKYSTSPDCSDGNEASSAPSEFLAEVRWSFDISR